MLQHKTQQPVQFELTDQTCESVAAWIAHAKLRPDGFLFPSRMPLEGYKAGAMRR